MHNICVEPKTEPAPQTKDAIPIEDRELSFADLPKDKHGNTLVASVPVQGLYRAGDGELIVGFKDNRGIYQSPSVRSAVFRSHIRYSIYKSSGEALTEAQLKEFVEHIAAYCELYGNDVTIFNRVARDGNDLLIDGINCVYRIVPGAGWEETKISSPFFRRSQGMLPLVKPLPGGDVKKLLDFVNLSDERLRILFLVNFVASLVPNIPHPALIIYGPQGASKSTIVKYMVSLLDPAFADDVSYRNEKEFMLAAGSRWIVNMDNVSFVDPVASDIFCKLVTGASYTARQLYTDDTLIIRRFQRVLIINGVNLPVDKPDLMDRCLLMPLERIPPHRRQSEAELRTKFDAIKGELLGACFDTLSKAMAIYPTVTLRTKERMADFQVWGCAIAEALGFNQELFLQAWAQNIELQHEESLEASPIAALVVEWFRSNPSYNELSGTPSHVYRKLKILADDVGIDSRSLPKNPRAFGKKLQEVRPNLEAHGYIVDRVRGKDRTWTIFRPKREASTPSFPSYVNPPSPAVNA